jgi:dienelactone hydrolase
VPPHPGKNANQRLAIVSGHSGGTNARRLAGHRTAHASCGQRRLCAIHGRRRKNRCPERYFRLNAILDAYRSIAVLSAHPRVDPDRIAVMAFSRGGQASLYASVKRFQKLWNTAPVEPAAYIALYPQCTTTFIGDTDVSDHPIRIFHGTADDYNEIAPCRRYFQRIKGTAKDIDMTEFPDIHHVYDYPLLSTTPGVVRNGQTNHCILAEGPAGVIINADTQKPFTYADACVGRDPHTAYSAAATRATEDAVKNLLKAAFKLD